MASWEFASKIAILPYPFWNDFKSFSKFRQLLQTIKCYVCHGEVAENIALPTILDLVRGLKRTRKNIHGQ